MNSHIFYMAFGSLANTILALPWKSKPLVVPRKSSFWRQASLRRQENARSARRAKFALRQRQASSCCKERGLHVLLHLGTKQC